MLQFSQAGDGGGAVCVARCGIFVVSVSGYALVLLQDYYCVKFCLRELFEKIAACITHDFQWVSESHCLLDEIIKAVPLSHVTHCEESLENEKPIVSRSMKQWECAVLGSPATQVGSPPTK